MTAQPGTGDGLSVDAIRESRQDGYWGSPVDGYEALEAECHVDYLLTMIERLQVVVGAARILIAEDDRMLEQGIDGGILDMRVLDTTVDALDDLKAKIAALDTKGVDDDST